MDEKLRKLLEDYAELKWSYVIYRDSLRSCQLRLQELERQIEEVFVLDENHSARFEVREKDTTIEYSVKDLIVPNDDGLRMSVTINRKEVTTYPESDDWLFNSVMKYIQKKKEKEKQAAEKEAESDTNE